ncbi:DUF4181 domain-containing protein [Rossellomorea vietnamensis]|uniref:DUF4181 domain-containing protein n=1 Tax=Rossellomorea vietnamensis TaxID=218284 RepID=A0A6I6UCG2_9BACI|nr:DUF4181 domain-containing protein [Rossellomorea vietnamensis]QHE60435.1 DUF4181 domain-containing protein [Rossellomorea vietnamensis]
MGLFFLKVILILMIYLLLMYTFHRGISSWLSVDKRKIFSHDIINEHHEKADTIHRKIMVFALFSCVIIDVIFDFEYWYQNPYSYVLILLFSGSFLKAYMEWKYVENKRECTYTVLETSFGYGLLLLLLTVGIELVF